MKYLFTSFHQTPSGEKYIEQTPEDKSAENPLKSAFFDVLREEERGNPCLMFCLTGNGHNYLVDLRDGRFEIDGASFYLHPPIQGCRLVYYRSVSRMFTMEWQDIEQKTDSFHMGWQALVNGESVKHILTIN